ncbi:LPXTG cell wall anchor domain-containing protein [Paenibacillus sp. BSR1-1]|uniref:LPXTG cell wall anchor domain-containing protein n=1 Tax=Paenibacillus sp. BSR1-1 TaxID=3020845 RepID=UPI0025B13CBC|nr:LPXTG cell wall anchor domain-containing protein [Paenibacillus sp. BSR1-1]MDN3016063.1 LPXTG cell wall anchor domain-containing protein [Paenibacillus sp. BSR1-1]
MKKNNGKWLLLVLMYFLLSLQIIPTAVAAKGQQAKEKVVETNQTTQQGNPAQARKGEGYDKKGAGTAAHKQDKLNHDAYDSKVESNQKNNPSNHKVNVSHQKTNKNDHSSKKAVNNPQQSDNQNNTQSKNDYSKEIENSTTTPQNSNSNKSTQIHLHLNKCYKSVTHVYVYWGGKWKAMSSQGNSPLYKLHDGGQYVKDDVSAFKLITADNQERIFQVSEMKVGVEAQGTINYWLNRCDQISPPPGNDDQDDNENSTPPPGTNPNNHENETPPSQNNGNGAPEKPASSQEPSQITDGSNTSYSGLLPKTGESSPISYYLIGLFITAVGVYLLKKSKVNQTEV